MIFIGTNDYPTNIKMVRLYVSHFFCYSLLPSDQNKETNKKVKKTTKYVFFNQSHFEITEQGFIFFGQTVIMNKAVTVYSGDRGRVNRKKEEKEKAIEK